MYEAYFPALAATEVRCAELRTFVSVFGLHTEFVEPCCFGTQSCEQSDGRRARAVTPT
jgi:hypothetical protein